MTSRTGDAFGVAATEQSVRAALLEGVRVLKTGDLDGLVRWCLACCTDLLGAAAAALVEPDRAALAERWRVSATDESVRELIELDLELPAGACRDCLDRGEPTTLIDLLSPGVQWAEFAVGARKLHFTWAQAQPLRLQGAVIGSLHLFGVSPDLPEDLDVELAHSLAELALVSGAQQHAVDVRSTEVAQLHTALDTRLVIEQAKGILASRHNIDVEQAFARLRRYARDHRMNIHDVARDVVVEHHTADPS